MIFYLDNELATRQRAGETWMCLSVCVCVCAIVISFQRERKNKTQPKQEEEEKKNSWGKTERKVHKYENDKQNT